MAPVKLQPATAYQGGKQRIACQILDIVNPDKDHMFHDLCCGSGSIAIELVNRGHLPEKIHMLDRGPWGLVWKLVGNGCFDLNRFSKICDDIPKDRREIKSYLEDLSKQPAEIDTPYIYLLLQAGSFGSKAIWISKQGNSFRWMNCSFRSYWEPTANSNRRSPVNPMMPMPSTLFDRMTFICQKLKGITGYCCEIDKYLPEEGIAYIDPPYQGTTFYGYDFDVVLYAKSLSIPVYVSEGRPLSPVSHMISSGRNKGGISGERKKAANQEWLSVFNLK